MKTLANLLLLFSLALLAGCPPKGGPAAQSKPVAAAAGGVVSLPLEAEPDDPQLKSYDFSDPRLWAVARAVEVPLVRALPDGALVQGLASSWTPDQSGQNWSFTLRPVPGHESDPGYSGVQLKAYWLRLLRGPAGPLRAQLADLVAGAKDYSEGRGDDVAGIQVSGGELKLALTRPDRLAPLWLSQPGLGLCGRGGGPWLGPFKPSGLQHSTLKLLPNPAALDGKPLLDELRFVCLTDRAKQLELYRAGQLDAANVAPDGVDASAADPDLAPALKQYDSAASLVGCFNLSHFPWQDSKFQSKQGLRQAANWGLSREDYGAALPGLYEPWPHFLPGVFKQSIDPQLVQQPLYPNAPEIEKAREGLKRADHEQGSHLIPGMDLAYLSGYQLDGLARLMLDDWEAVSIKLQPFPLTRRELEIRVTNKTHEILLIRACPAYPDPDALLYPLLHSNLAGVGGNYSYLSDSKVDAALAAEQAAADPAVRLKQLRDLSRDLEDRALLVFVGALRPAVLISPRLAGYALTPYDFDASLPAQDFARLGLRQGQGGGGK